MVSETRRSDPGRTGAKASKSENAAGESGGSKLGHALDAIFRFLSSLKLAVISLSTLAGVLAYATFYEKWHGTAAVQDEIYKHPGFAILLAFLGINILCAALIRYPWTKRQTGFVITHAGLLVVLLGSWISFSVTDDGQVGMVEGDRSDELVRIDHAAMWVQPIDPKTKEPTGSVAYKLPFHPGTFPWESTKPTEAGQASRSSSRNGALGVSLFCGAGLVGLIGLWVAGRLRTVPEFLRWTAAGVMGIGAIAPLSLVLRPEGPRQEILTTVEEPFELKVKDYHPASSAVFYAPVEGKGGVPMVEAGLYITPPNSDQRVDIFDRFDDGTRTIRWFKADNPRLGRMARDLGLVLFTFQYAEDPTMVEDFLDLPDEVLGQERVRMHYKDKAGNPQVYVWPSELVKGQEVTLPGSDIVASYENKSTLPLNSLPDQSGEMTRATGELELSFIEFLVKKEGGTGEKYISCSSLPTLPNKPGEPNPLVRISYFKPPALGGMAMQGRSSVVDLLGTPTGKLYYRSFSREGLRGKGQIEVKKPIELVTKSMGQPVTYTLRVGEYLTSGVDNYDCNAIELAPNERDGGIPAALVELSTGKGDARKTKEVWVRRMHPTHDFRHLFRPVFDFVDENRDGLDDRDGHIPRFETVEFDNGESYRVGLDFDRRKLGFEIELANFEMGTDPGTQQASSYESDVLLTDEKAGLDEKSINISMNEPLTWKDHTFYQSNFDRVRDPRGRETGQFISVFQVRYDPDWCWGTIYGGCLLVVLGTFVQFYMRAGLFTDGGKKERERAERKAAAKLAKDAPRETSDALMQRASVAARADDEPL